MIKAFAVHEPGAELKPYEYDPGPLGEEHVEIQVEFCGLCHSDLSMLNNDWGLTTYPFVPGHEIIGRIAAIGSQVRQLQVGQRVGLGWFSRSCMACDWCMSGDHNLCLTAEQTIVGRHGGFADTVRAHWGWVIPLPEELTPESSGPLFCGGITVFNPIVQLAIKPTDRVGVIGIGGLGHMAIRFLHAWGCDVTAFSSSPDKEAEAREMGANHFVNSRDPEAIKALANHFDVILSTVNVDLDWEAYIAALRPRGRLHFVGAVAAPISVQFFSLLMNKSVSATPLGSPATIRRMLEFSSRHQIEPIVEYFPFSQVNEAVEKLRSGKPRYRIVLKQE